MYRNLLQGPEDRAYAPKQEVLHSEGPPATWTMDPPYKRKDDMRRFPSGVVELHVATHLPDPLWLRDSHVEQDWTGRLHAGIPAQGRFASPPEGCPAPWQEVHKQDLGV